MRTRGTKQSEDQNAGEVHGCARSLGPTNRHYHFVPARKELPGRIIAEEPHGTDAFETCGLHLLKQFRGMRGDLLIIGETTEPQHGHHFLGNAL